ncbi:MAG TPA: hypothetical protein VIF40_15620 [Methylosinus sp.]|uniref:hypothetical protein n=1 Tax=Methylosinus sp. TaxID=427 RepID=UPI002F952B7A
MLIIRDDSFDALDSIAIWGVTTDETDAPLFGLLVVERNGLRVACRSTAGK